MSDEISRIIKDAASGQWHTDRDSETETRIKRLETVVAGIPLPSDITKAVRMTLGDEADPTKPGLAAVAEVTGTIAEEHIGIRTEQIKLAERLDKLERRSAIWGVTSVQSGGGGAGGGGGSVKIEATPDPTARTGWRPIDTEGPALNAEIQRLKEHSKLIEKLHRDKIREQHVTQRELEKFMGACADQTIQIMEMRGVVRRLVTEREEAIAKVRELETKLGEAQHRGATAETEHRRASRAFDELASKHNALQERHASVQRALDDAIKQRERIEAAHWQGVEQYRAEHPDQNTTLPPVRSELVRWLLEQREQLAEQLAVADADRVPLRMDLDEARGKLERLAPIVELLPTWAERATPGMLNYERALHDAVVAWQAAERAADESPDEAG